MKKEQAEDKQEPEKLKEFDITRREFLKKIVGRNSETKEN